MTKTASKIVLVVAAMTSLSQSPLAHAQTLPPQVAACAKENNDIARLQCYDRQNPPERIHANPVSSGDAAPAPQPMAVPKVSQHPVANESKTPPKVSANSAADFGLSDSQLRKAQAGAGDADTRVERITAQVREVSQRAHGELLLKLDNGQLWTQTEHHPGEPIRSGEQVTIRRGSLGAFLLTSASRVTTRVRRLE